MTTKLVKKTSVKKAEPKAKKFLEDKHISWLKTNLYLDDNKIKWLVKQFGEERILKTFYEERDSWSDEVFLESSLMDSEDGSGESLPFNCGIYVGEASNLFTDEDVMQLLLYAASQYRHILVTVNHSQKNQFKLLKSNGFEVIRGYMGNPNHGNKTKIAVLMYTFPQAKA